MKKSGILNAELSKCIALLGHGQTLVIADYGLPIPKEVPTIDLAITKDTPSFLTVLRTVLAELSIEGITLASELPAQHPELFKEIEKSVDVPIQTIRHEELKERLSSASVIVRTGEWTSYANAILQSGVIF